MAEITYKIEKGTGKCFSPVIPCHGCRHCCFDERLAIHCAEYGQTVPDNAEFTTCEAYKKS